MWNLLNSLIATTVVIIALTIVCDTWGRSAFNLLGVQNAQNFECETLWMGFAMLLSAIEFLHLFVPIDWRVSLLVLGTALIPYLKSVNRARLNKSLKDLLQFCRKHNLKILILVAIMILWCLRSMGVPNNFDSGLYHFGSIRWMNEYPIVPGLGNLHWRLGLNQSYFGYVSLVNFFPFWNKGYSVGGLYLAYLTVLTIFQIAQQQEFAWRWLVGGLLFLYVGFLVRTLPNPSPDTAIGLLEVSVFCLMFLIFSNQRQFTHDAEKINQFTRNSTTVLMLSIALITIKLSSIAFALASIAITLWLQFRCVSQDQKGFKNQRSLYYKLPILILIIGIIHIFRGYLLTGAPFFPNTIAAAWGFDWSVLKEVAIYESNFIFSWARKPGDISPNQVLQNWGWISDWLKSLPTLDVISFLTASILMLINLFFGFIKNNQQVRDYSKIYLPIWAALFFWFFTAPDIRFLGAILVIYISLSIWLFYSLITTNKLIFNKIHSTVHIIPGVLAIAICLISLKLTEIQAISLNGWMPVPKAEIKTQESISKLQVNVSLNGQCWDVMLPCASIFNGNLHADPLNLPWPFSIINNHRFFYSVKFLNLPK